jgi:hypothetical protein
MNKQEIKTKIDQLEAQREQLLMQLGGINGALAVYNDWLKSLPDAAPAVVSAGEVQG